ncbi:MAG: hypothetical protein HYW70_01135 [Candidatus Nealsonbacteria bacterium]|nr:hypothetical protein [Candidatus Nealsonbacteria bacterium]
MVSQIILIALFLFWLKCFLFWLWLWQLKEYHIGRFLAHFETQKVKKFISSFWRIKYPKFTKKITIVLFAGQLLAVLWMFFLPGFLLVILSPIFSSILVLFFQIPTVVWRRILINKAKEKRERFPDLIVIGITGSYGKTSTKEILAHILSKKFNVLKTKEHQNSEVGVSQCILRELGPEHQIFVVEMGAYNMGGIKLLCDIVKPRIGILTGINEQHMATFGSQESIIKTKYELIESLPKDGIAFFNGKNKYCRELYQKTLRAGSSQAFLYGENVKMPGLENVEGAKAVARELGMADEEVSQASKDFENKLPGVEIKRGINGLNILDASYSANPNSVMAHLDYLQTLSGKKIIIMPCLIELGRAAKEVHKRIGEMVARVCDLAIITTNDYFKELKGESDKIILIESPKEILKKIKEVSHPGDPVLLEGRISVRLYKILLSI